MTAAGARTWRQMRGKWSGYGNVASAVGHLFGWWHSGRMSVFGWRTFPVLRSTCSWRVTTYVGKPSAIGQPTRPTQPFILSGSIDDWVVSCNWKTLTWVCAVAPSGERLWSKGMHGVFAGKTVWSMPECIEIYIVYKRCYINTLPFLYFPFQNEQRTRHEWLHLSHHLTSPIVRPTFCGSHHVYNLLAWPSIIIHRLSLISSGLKVHTLIDSNLPQTDVGGVADPPPIARRFVHKWLEGRWRRISCSCYWSVGGTSYRVV